MSILVLGMNGQVGRALQKSYANSLDVHFLHREQCDLSDEIQLKSSLEKIAPQIIINAAAYTAVDHAESNPEVAFLINENVPAILAEYVAQKKNGLLIHYSTDYVFCDSKEVPYDESDTPDFLKDLGIYAQSKLAGELAITNAFAGSSKQAIYSAYYILRTSWVYGNGSNFIQTILRLATDKERLNVVSDQVGAPTSATFLAQVAFEIVRAHQAKPTNSKSGIYHAVGCGSTSWYGLATYVLALAEQSGVKFSLKSDSVYPIQASAYPTSAKRPYNSRLHNAKLQECLKSIGSNIKFQDWQIEVREYVESLFLANNHESK